MPMSMPRFPNGPVATSFFLVRIKNEQNKKEQKRIKNVVSLEYFIVSRFSGYRKNTSYKRSQTFHEVCVQGKGVYIDRNTYAYILSILNISLYLLNIEFPLIVTKIVPFSILFDHCENKIIRIRIPFFLKEEASSSRLLIYFYGTAIRFKSLKVKKPLPKLYFFMSFPSDS